MKKTFLIIFQYSQAITPILVEHIKEEEMWAKIADNIWCIKSFDVHPRDVRERYLGLTNNEQGKLMVINITTSSWASAGVSQQVADWLNNNNA